jgi:hypothetical protein
MARGSVVLQNPRPHGGAVVHDGSSVGAGVLQRDEKIKIKKIKIKKKFKIFLISPPPTMACGSVVLQHPHPHGGAVVHDGSSVGAGVLQRDEKKN